ncbi:MBL fold metallo-hydrolase [Chondromyces crocatus]|uniref:Zn-dependent hydrolase n=1 Tax=Chondromyces crocatus TaxID=52 RepID=A0A0K1EHI3_CHOCO|nr:MBL fold metallo-hydrolase [Chondromyces crocatus]AKT40314.1 Zn-dependent hydrolase [Chondromyces crocatus]
MTKGRRSPHVAKVRLALAAAALVGIAALLRTCASAPLPAGPALAVQLPPATPPAGMTLHRLPTGFVHRRAASAYRGGSFFEERNSAVIAALIAHPRGDLLIDTGFGRDIDAQFQRLPLAFRLVTTYERALPAVEQLRAAGYEPNELRILLTHAHWDHTSGLADFPTTPVLITREERRFVDEGGVRTVVARSTSAVHYEEYDFEGGPYLGYPKSHDLYGDGAIVVVPAPGHTPGSVIVFVSLPAGKRYAFIGDLAWQREGVVEREERPWIWRLAVDSDEAKVRDGLVHLSALSAQFQEITIVPAHDARGFADLPLLQP